MLLVLDTTNNKKTTVKLGEFEVREVYNDPRRQKILEVIDKILKRKKIVVSQISQININTGPGFFTSLRVGCAVANTLAWGLGIKVNGKNWVEPRYD